MSADTPGSNVTSPQSSDVPHRSLSQSSRYSGMGMSPISQRMSFGSLQWGNANALLYDTRENRTKTAVTAVLKGTPVIALLRSYDARKETAPDVNCTIWEAGRATSATALAFKPIKIGQSVYLDEGAGKYNPAPMVLDEAVQNEWPGREVGVFVSIGTGKRPAGTNNQQHEWWEGFLGGSMGDFAEARRRLISKMEGCEDTHQLMLREHLSNRQVDVENYYRLNVEVGVGEFGMNEWARLSEISTNTRMYLSRRDVETLNQGAAAKIAKIQFAKIRHDRAERGEPAANGYGERYSWQDPLDKPLPPVAPPPNPVAVELPGDDMYFQTQGFRPGAQQYDHRPSIADQKYVVVSNDHHAPQAPPGSGNPQTPPQRPAQPVGQQGSSPYQSPSSLHQQSSLRQPNPSHTSSNNPSPRVSHDSQQRPSPPPLPPKTPIESLPHPDQMSPQSPSMQSPSTNGPRTFMNMGDLGRRLPYPDVEGPPPAVNTANKPAVSR